MADIVEPIKALSLKYLKVQLRDNSDYWKPLKVFKKTYKTHQIVTAFEQWAKENIYSGITNPLQAFAQVFIGLESGDESSPLVFQQVKNDPGVDDLCVDLSIIGDTSYGAAGPFTGRHRVLVADLRKDYTAKEIKDAYAAFISECDDFTIKSAVKKFAEGGGKDYILKARREAQLFKEQNELQEKLALEFQQKRAAALAASGAYEDDDDVTEIKLPEAK